MIHLGGDGIHLGCWNSSYQIQKEIRIRGGSTDNQGVLQLWNEFLEWVRDSINSNSGQEHDFVIWEGTPFAEATGRPFSIQVTHGKQLSKNSSVIYSGGSWNQVCIHKMLW